MTDACSFSAFCHGKEHLGYMGYTRRYHPMYPMVNGKVGYMGSSRPCIEGWKLHPAKQYLPSRLWPIAEYQAFGLCPKSTDSI